MRPTITIDQYGEARFCIPLPEPVIKDILDKAEQDRPPEGFSIWDLDEGIWCDFEGPDYSRLSIGPDGLTINLLVGSPDPLDHTLPPALALDDELHFIRIARLVLDPYMDQVRSWVRS